MGNKLQFVAPTKKPQREKKSAEEMNAGYAKKPAADWIYVDPNDMTPEMKDFFEIK